MAMRVAVCMLAFAACIGATQAQTMLTSEEMAATRGAQTITGKGCGEPQDCVYDSGCGFVPGHGRCEDVVPYLLRLCSIADPLGTCRETLDACQCYRIDYGNPWMGQCWFNSCPNQGDTYPGAHCHS